MDTFRGPPRVFLPGNYLDFGPPPGSFKFFLFLKFFLVYWRGEERSVNLAHHLKKDKEKKGSLPEKKARYITVHVEGA